MNNLFVRIKEIAQSYLIYLYINIFKVKKIKKIYLYRPTMSHINKSAKINISNKLKFNYNWENIRVLKNIIPGQLFVGRNAELNVNDFTIFSGCKIIVDDNAHLNLGSGYINHNCSIACCNSITIKNNVIISEGVTIRDSDNHTIVREGYQKEAPIVIEDNVWIGLNCTILKGVTIGKGCIIAAGTLVNKDCPPNCLIAGVPGKVVKENIKWEI